MDVFTPSLSRYRVYNDDGTEATSTPIAAENTAATVAAQFGALSAVVHLRVGIGNATAVGDTASVLQLMVSRNGGAFQNVTGASTIVKAAASALTNDGATTDRATNGISNPAGTFQAGVQEEANGAITHTLGGSAFTEHVFAIQIDGNDVAHNDSLTFKVQDDGADFTHTVTPTITVSQTNPTISSATMADAGRDFDAPHQDITITFSEAVDGAPAVDATIPGLVAGPSGSEGAVTYRSGDGTNTWVVRRAALAQFGTTWVIDYSMAAGSLLAVDDNAELRETANAAVTNNLTKRIRMLLKNDAGAAVTTAVDMMCLDGTPRDSDDAAWMADLQKNANVTPSGTGLVDIQAPSALAVGDTAYMAIFNPREDATGGATSYARTALVATTVT